MTTGTYSYYRLGLPLRFTEKDQVSDVSGEDSGRPKLELPFPDSV